MTSLSCLIFIVLWRKHQTSATRCIDIALISIMGTTLFGHLLSHLIAWRHWFCARATIVSWWHICSGTCSLSSCYHRCLRSLCGFLGLNYLLFVCVAVAIFVDQIDIRSSTCVLGSRHNLRLHDVHVELNHRWLTCLELFEIVASIWRLLRTVSWFEILSAAWTRVQLVLWM